MFDTEFYCERMHPGSVIRVPEPGSDLGSRRVLGLGNSGVTDVVHASPLCLDEPEDNDIYCMPSCRSHTAHLMMFATGAY